MIELVDTWRGARKSLLVTAVLVDANTVLREEQIVWLAGAVRSPALPTGRPHVYTSLSVKDGRYHVDRWLRYYDVTYRTQAHDALFWVRKGWVGVSDHSDHLPAPLDVHRRRTNSYTPTDECFVAVASDAFPRILPCVPRGTMLHEYTALQAAYERCVNEYVRVR